MMAGVGGGRDMLVRYLARRAASWHVLHTYHHHGLAAAAEALGICGGGGRDGDGAVRFWCTESGGRRFVVRLGDPSAPATRLPVREVLDFVDHRLTAAEWQRIDQLAVARRRAAGGAQSREFYYSPTRRSDAENARIAAARRAMAVAERQMRAIVAAVLVDDRWAGEQLDLFASE